MDWIRNKGRRSTERVDISTSYELSQYLRGHDSAAGVEVSDRAVLGLPAAYAAIRAVSEVVAMLPLRLLRQDSNGKVMPAREHRLYRLMADAPNNYQTSTEFISLMQARLCVRHNAFALIESRGTVIERLMPVHPQFVQVNGDTRTGVVTYDLWDENGKIEKGIPASKMLHIRGFSDSGFIGWGVSDLLRDAIGAAIATERYTQRVMANGAHIPGYLKGANLTPEQARKIVDQMAEYRGANNAGKLPLFPGEIEWVKMGMTAVEAEILGTKKLMIEDVARMFRVPPHIIGEQSKISYASQEQSSREFLDYSIVPWLTRWEQRLGYSLLTPSERRNGYFWHFETGALVRANLVDRYAAYQSGIQSGWLTRNEARAKEDLPSLPGLDEPLTPLNMVEEGELTEEVNG